jgi:hypothetical protein
MDNYHEESDAVAHGNGLARFEEAEAALRFHCAVVWQMSPEAFRKRFMVRGFEPSFPEDFTKVAFVSATPGGLCADDLLARAWRLTNHVEEDWTEGDEVCCLQSESRSTSVGDVIGLMEHVYDGDDPDPRLELRRIYRVDPVGFGRIETS